jgi:hypothetical protein
MMSMRRMGYRWQQGEIRAALAFWLPILLAAVLLVFAVAVSAYRWPL